MLNLSSTVRSMCCLTSHSSACSKLLDLNAARSICANFTLKNCSFKIRVVSWKSKVERSKKEGEETFLTTDFADGGGLHIPVCA